MLNPEGSLKIYAALKPGEEVKYPWCMDTFQVIYGILFQIILFHLSILYITYTF